MILKKKLQIEVTKIKEKLENYLSQSNNLIKINEKIKQGIKKLYKEKNINYKNYYFNGIPVPKIIEIRHHI